MIKRLIKVNKDEEGSLALEQVLFIGAIVAMSAGLFAFYNGMGAYLQGVGFSASPGGVGGTNAPQAGGSSGG